MVLGPGEPAAGPWRRAAIADLAALLLGTAGEQRQRPRIVAVDGRSAGGKTTLAERLHAALPGSAVVHTDDVAWYHSFFGWSDLLLGGVLLPLHQGQGVRYRPPAWDEHGREGAIEVPSGCPAVLIEGVGAARRDLLPWLDAVVWVQSDLGLAQRRGVTRDGGDQAAASFWDEWAAEEIPFLQEQRPWEHATVIVAGTPVLDHDPATEVVVSCPPRRDLAG